MRDSFTAVTSTPKPVVTGGNVVVPNESDAQRLLRAKGYPYPRPDTSFLFVRGEVFPFDNPQWRGLDSMHEIVGRCGTSAVAFCSARGVDLVGLSRGGERFVPVLAIGSNAGPEQLRRKYPAEDFPDCIIPVVQVALEDFDVVYTPYIASYGSCTATLEHSPGTVTSIFITYLTPPLMERMHATEGGYNLCRLSGLRLHVAPATPLPPAAGAAAPGAGGSEYLAHPAAGKSSLSSLSSEGAGGSLARPVTWDAADFGVCGGSSSSSFEVRDWVYQYNHKLGCMELPLLGRAGSPIAITDIPAQRRVFPAASQVQMLSALQAALGNASAGPLETVALTGLHSSTAHIGLDEWILHMLRSSEARANVCDRLAECARPFMYPRTELVVML